MPDRRHEPRRRHGRAERAPAGAAQGGPHLGRRHRRGAGDAARGARAAAAPLEPGDDHREAPAARPGRPAAARASAARSVAGAAEPAHHAALAPARAHARGDVHLRPPSAGRGGRRRGREAASRCRALYLVHRYSGRRAAARQHDRASRDARGVRATQASGRRAAPCARRTARSKAVPLADGAGEPAPRLGVRSAAVVGIGLASIGMPRFDWKLADASCRTETRGGRAGRPRPRARRGLPSRGRAPAPSSPRSRAPPAATRRPRSPASSRDGSPQRDQRAACARRSTRVLRAWRVPARAAPTRRSSRRDQVARRPSRGLEELRLTGNLSMLRLLDLPAILEIATARDARVDLRRPDRHRRRRRRADGRRRDTCASRRRCSTACGSATRSSSGATSSGSGPPSAARRRAARRTAAEAADARGPVRRPGERRVRRSDQTAVSAFQRTRRLDPDCRVGRLTRIALYGVAGGYALPTLAGHARIGPEADGPHARRRCVVSSILEALRELEGERPPADRREHPAAGGGRRASPAARPAR